MPRFLFFCTLLVSASTAFPQPGTDTTYLSASIQNTTKLYRKAIGVQARLYNGSKYLAPDHTLEEHPYFFSEDWIIGDVFYDGEYFQNVPLMHDLSTSQLITEHFSSGHAIQLVQEKLQHFSMSGHYFEKIENESVGGSLPQTAFYDILYPGRTKVVARRQKFLREKIESSTIHRSFDEKNRYFIFKNGVFFPVKSKASVFRILRDKKQEMKKFLKQQNVSFKDDRELALKNLAEYYDTLR
ncbi:MAG: hypothetical protein WD824_09075 [Cyclobacteriaceae bacterium]